MKTASAVLLRYRDSDTAFGVSRNTVTRLAKTLGLSETQVIHVALAQFARQTLPGYEPDDGPLTDAQKKEIEQLQPSGRMKVEASLF
jgi:DNA-binding MurR/RpiR family transcriptional regulator